MLRTALLLVTPAVCLAALGDGKWPQIVSPAPAFCWRSAADAAAPPASRYLPASLTPRALPPLRQSYKSCNVASKPGSASDLYAAAVTSTCKQPDGFCSIAKGVRMDTKHCNQQLCDKGKNGKFTQYFKIQFEEPVGGVAWSFKGGFDSSYGYEAYLNNKKTHSKSDDHWSGGSSGLLDVAFKKVPKGQHTVEILGWEDCCDGCHNGWNVQRNKPAGDSSRGLNEDNLKKMAKATSSAPPPPPPCVAKGTCVIACVGAWGQWSTCSKSCGGGRQAADYAITKKANNGGTPCETTNGDSRVRSCNSQTCPTVTAATACKKKPCSNGAGCTDGGSSTSYTCSCNAGWTGKDCDTDIDDCANYPCKNSGNCRDAGNQAFSCTCAGGWKGKTCTEDSDDCSPNPCQNQGDCTDKGTNYFKCKCAGGFTGQYCDMSVPGYTSKPSPTPCPTGTLCASGGADAAPTADNSSTIMIVAVVAAAAVAVIAINAMKGKSVGPGNKSIDKEFSSEAEMDYEFEEEGDGGGGGGGESYDDYQSRKSGN